MGVGREGRGSFPPGFSYMILIVEGGLLVLFFGHVFSVGSPLLLEIFLPTPLAATTIVLKSKSSKTSLKIKQ